MLSTLDEWDKTIEKYFSRETKLEIIGVFNRDLFFLFLVLKLCHVITWSWIWISSPLYGPLLMVAICFIAGFVADFLKDVIKYLEKKHEQSRHKY